MIKEAIRFLKESLVDPSDRVVEFVDIDGIDRSFIVDENGRGHEVKSAIQLARSPLYINTLSGLVGYIKANLERKDNKFYLHVESEDSVTLTGLLDKQGEREKLVVANAITPDFEYGHFHDVEELIIALQSKFTKTKDRDILLKVIGNLKEENVKNTGDTGVAQAVTIKTGITNVGDVVVPNPVTLAPYRTFLEVDQPDSEFIFRMKDGPRGAIFEADGGAWRNEAIDNVRDYLDGELSIEIIDGKITIIA